MSMILAIDSSTSATKAMLFSTTGALLDAVSREHAQHYPQPGWVEHDAAEIYANTLAAADQLLAQNHAARGDLLCLSMTNQRETIVVFDRATGEPLYRAIVWQCRRGEALCKALNEQGLGEAIQQKTGLKIDTYFPASKLTWLFENVPGLKERVQDGRALVGTIDAYLIYRLTGGRVFATDHTNASRTLLYNIAELRWDQDLCELFGVPMQALPEVRESSAAFGETDLGGLLDEAIPICGVMGDSQAALFGERCYSPGMAKITFGTGSSVLMNIGSQMIHSSRGMVTTIGWVHKAKPVYALEGIINYTGATIAWLCDQLGVLASAGESEALAESVPDNCGVYVVPAFVGLSAPYWRPDVRGAILGLTPAATRAHIVRAALEAIGYRVRDVLGLMSQDASVSTEVVHGDGGAVQNRFLMQFVADVTRASVRASTVSEVSALGAVLAGLLGLGVYGSLEALEALPAGRVVYEPRLDSRQADTLYAGWLAAVKQVVGE